jgi:hypothetical protein
MAWRFSVTIGVKLRHYLNCFPTHLSRTRFFPTQPVYIF